MSASHSHHVYRSVVKSMEKLGATAATKVLAGVSGGMDSMVLLHILHSQGYKVAAAHVNFNLRGDASEADAHLVRTWCTEYNIPHYELSEDTQSFAAEHNLNTQLAARDIRYAWWEQLVQEHSFDLIATAHHFDDNIETLFMNLLRGTGLKGLTGIPAIRERYIRPLLDVSRDEINAYAKEYNIPYRNDESNDSDDYQRNKIRHHLIPLLREMYPGLSSGMKHTLHRIQTEWDTWQGAYDSWAASHVMVDGNGYQINGGSETLGFQLRWLEAKGIPWNLSYDYLSAAKTASGIALKYNGLSLSRTATGFFLETFTQPIIFNIQQPGKYTFDDFELSIEHVPIDQFHPGEDPFTVFMNERVVTWPLEIRSIQPGDWFQPFGMHGKSKKIQDFLVDLKLGMHEKNRQLVLTNDRHILWVVGLRLDERARVDLTGSHMYKISYRKTVQFMS